MWKLKLLEELNFFDQFSRAEKKEIAALENVFLGFTKGDIILAAGEQNSAFFLLLRGEVKVTKGDDDKQAVARLGPGDLFGEMSFLTHELTANNVIAREETTVIKLEEIQVRRLSLEIQNKLKDRFIQTLAHRIKRMNKIWYQYVKEHPPL